jgi:predicted dehydrogenase
MTIWACQAGKDVYVEKPVCHDIWEGQRMLEAEKKYGRIIQGGTQNRSNAGFKEGLDFLRSGALGEIKWIHGIDYKYRKSMGKLRGPQRIPPSVDYNLFRGPASMKPLNREHLHYDWHWQWDTGNGDMGNIAAHTVDNLRHIMGDGKQPDRVMSLGGRFLYDDDGETPNVHLAHFDYAGIPTFVEIRNIPFKPGVDYMDNLRESRQSCVVQCEGGYMMMADGAFAYSNDGKRIQAFQGNGVKEHVANFIEAVRNQDSSLLNCPLKVAVQAGEMFHMANLSYRSGFPASPQVIEDVIGGSEAGLAALKHIQTNLTRLGIDLNKEPLTLGSWMSLEDSGRKLNVHNSDCELLAQALFERRQYRKPYVVPEHV